jgi:hypothetical protein
MSRKTATSLANLILDADADEADARFTGTGLVATALPVTRDQFVEAISSLWRQAQENFISIGRHLIRAKDALDHGEYEAMVEKDMPFAPAMARKFRAVAEFINRDEVPVAQLSASPTILYELATLTPEERAAASEAGIVRPDVRRAEIVAFKKRARDGRGDERPAPGRTKVGRLMEERDRLGRRIREIDAEIAEINSGR